MTRRTLLGAMAGSALGSPTDGLLKKRIQTRTFDVHAHIVGSPRRPGAAQKPPDSNAETLPPVTAEQREAALKRFSRFQHGVLQFDSPEQEELNIRKYTWRNYESAGVGVFEDNAAALLKEMDEAGLDTAVPLILDFAAPMLSKGPINPSTERIEALMAASAEVWKKNPTRFVPFIGIDVRRGKAGVPLVEKAVKEYGYKGAGEIVTTLWQTPPNDREKVYPYYEVCEHLKIPVMIDCTMDRGFTLPEQYEEVAKDFPKLRIGLGGAGIRVAPVEIDGVKMAARERILQLAKKHPNLWLDLDDWEVADRKGMDQFLDYLRRALDSPVRDRIMYGSDYPIFAWMWTQKEWIEFILKSGDRSKPKFTGEEWTLFFSTNASRYLGV